MTKTALSLMIAVVSFFSMDPASAFSIGGKYATLVSCDFGYSEERDESGNTGTYLVLGEYWTVYFGDDECAGGPV